MASVIKVGAKPAAKPSLNLSLPSEPNVPSGNLSDYSILLYGAKKIGKTSLAARFPDAFFLACEPGTKALRVFTRPVRTWEEYIGYLDLLEKTPGRFKTVVVDTIDILYEHAFNYVCKKHLIKHPSEENDHGATWKEITQLFQAGIVRLLNGGRGVMFLSHDTEREVELRDGSKIDRVQPTMAKQAMSVVEAAVDVIMNYAYEGKDRILFIDGAQNLVAGCRIEEHFLRKGGKPRTAGDRIVSIPMGKTAEEAFAAITRAFNNQQATVEAFPSTTKPVRSFVIGKK